MGKGLRFSSIEAMPAAMRDKVRLQEAKSLVGGERQVKRSKYGANAVVVDGIRFDSKREARHYQRLCLQKGIGEVLYFLRQVPIHLPGGTKLVVDFLVFYADGRVRYEDAKGVETPVFKVKRREVEAAYPIEIFLV